MQPYTTSTLIISPFANSFSKVSKLLLTLLITGFILTGISINVHAEDSSLYKLIQDDGQFSLLKDAVQKAGLEGNLSKTDGDKLTLLAPSNQALEKLPKGVLENLLKPENKDSLVKFLNYHLIGSVVNGVQIVSSKTLKTLEGGELTIKLTSSQILINDKVNLSKIDIKASNGVLHIIDEALVPSSINLESLASSVAATQSISSSESSKSTLAGTAEVSPVAAATPRTGSNFEVPMVLVTFGLIGAGLRMIVRPIKVKN